MKSTACSIRQELKVRFDRVALQQIEEIYDFIASDNPTAARRVLSAIHSSIDRLKTFPEAARLGLVPGTREILAGRYPYLIIYRVDFDQAEVIILGVFHTSRDPNTRADILGPRDED